jgi:hypothetical protein
MIAPDHKIIIDIGSDYEIWIQVPDGSLAFKDVREWNWTLKLYSGGKGATAPIQYKTDFTGVCPGLQAEDDTLYDDQDPVDYEKIQSLNGWVKVKIDAADTATFTTGLSADVDSFATEYNYRYTLDINDDAITPGLDTEEIRILRGKCAIRN